MSPKETDELVWGESEHVNPIFSGLCSCEPVFSCESVDVSVPPKGFWVREAHGKGVNLILPSSSPTDQVAFFPDVASLHISFSLCPKVHNPVIPDNAVVCPWSIS